MSTLPRLVSSSPRPPRFIRFGPFELDVRAGELRKHGTRLRLRTQTLQILRMLLERPGEVVLREEIRQQLWLSDTVVEFDHSINTAVKRLRDALAEPAGKPRFIETLPRRGYRFIGQVETGPGQPEATPLAVMPPAAKPDNLRWIAAGILGVVVAFAVAATWYYRRGAPARWAREVALPEITRRIDSGQEAAVFPLLYKALQILPQDPALNRLRGEISHPFT